MLISGYEFNYTVLSIYTYLIATRIYQNFQFNKQKKFADVYCITTQFIILLRAV